MTVGILAVQGAFIEHAKIMKQMGIDYFEIRQKSDLEKPFDALILPGGESSVQGKLLREQDMYNIIKEKIESGLPILATCAGLILLAGNLSNDEAIHFGTIPITVKRNAYGRQLGSFFKEEEVKGIGKFPMKFIRAPYIEIVSDGVEVLSKVDGNIVGIKYKNQFAFAFHPELTDDKRIHEMFVRSIKV